MDLDAKQKVLLAIYTEYQKDTPDMKLLTPDELGMEREVFNIALEKLYNESLIRDVLCQNEGDFPWAQFVDYSCAKMTPYGISYIEKKLSIDKHLSGLNKLNRVLEKASEWGLEQIKDMAAKTIAEYVTKCTQTQ